MNKNLDWLPRAEADRKTYCSQTVALSLVLDAIGDRSSYWVKPEAPLAEQGQSISVPGTTNPYALET